MQVLSCPPADHERAIGKLQAERRDTGKALRAATDELAGILAQQILASLPPSERLDVNS